jgi:hypothetical protein
MIAGRLTMRALVERNQATTKDAWGQPVAPDFQSTGDPLPCFVWSNNSSELVDGQKIAMLEELRAMFALGADVREDDEIASVTDRRAPRSSPAGCRSWAGPAQAHAPRGGAAEDRLMAGRRDRGQQRGRRPKSQGYNGLRSATSSSQLHGQRAGHAGDDHGLAADAGRARRAQCRRGAHEDINSTCASSASASRRR